MPLIRASLKEGYFEINENIRFMKDVAFLNYWNKTWYVDYDGGSDDNNGKSEIKPVKNPATALSRASAGDIIYIRPRSPELGAEGAGPYYGGDPGDITPATAVNWIIPYTKYGLSLIGCGAGRGPAGRSQTCLQGHADVTAYPVLDVRAPYSNIENLGFKAGGSTVGLVQTKFADNSIYQAWANTFYKVWFRIALATGALVMDAGSYDNIEKCTFSFMATGHGVGIMLLAGNDAPTGVVIRDCDFEGLVADIHADIQTSGAVKRILMDNLRFNHAVPTGGSPNKFVSIASASTGLLANSYCGAADATIATHFTLNGIHNAHIWGEAGEVT